MSFVAITIEGGLFPADFLDKLAAAPEELKGQQPADFGVNIGCLSGPIQSAFSDARTYWQALQHRLARAKESPTTLTRDAFVLPLLESLDYTLEYQRAAVQAGGASYALSHRAGLAEDAPPIHVVGHNQALDERGGAQRSPHALLQNLLNRTDALWGVVTNGTHLRLLRDTARLTRPTYLEVDLQAMIEGNLYAEFVVFYRLLHRSRFPQGGADADKCVLEHYYQQGGGRVRERADLRPHRPGGAEGARLGARPLHEGGGARRAGLRGWAPGDDRPSRLSRPGRFGARLAGGAAHSGANRPVAHRLSRPC